MSYISSDAEISDPRHLNAWRDEADGKIHATVRLGYMSTLYFGSAADARAVAAACTEAADALDRLTSAEITPGE